MKIVIDIPDDYCNECKEYEDICQEYALEQVIILLEAIRENHKKTRKHIL